MIVVHTVNQLEEALRGRAKEILVTGELFDSVKEIFPYISGKEVKPLAAGTSREEISAEIGGIPEIKEVPKLENSSILLLTGNFTAVALQDSPCCPSIKLKRKNRS